MSRAPKTPDDSLEPPAVSEPARAARRRRIARGQAQEAEARERTRPRGLQSILAFPLLEALEAQGGKARPRDVYEQIADRLNMPVEARREMRSYAGGRSYNVLEQQVRWARQAAKSQGLIVDAGRGLWELADPAYEKLGRVRRGVAILAWSTDHGIGLWAHAEDAASEIPRSSVQLVFTSPIYPIQSARAYGGIKPAAWVDWMTRLTRLWADLLTDDGIIAVNVADTHIPGMPAISSYLYRYFLSCIDDIGLYEQPPLFWVNPSKMGNIQWTATERRNPKAAVEYIRYFSTSPFPRRTVDQVLVPRKVTGARAAKDADRPREVRPSGHNITAARFYGGGDAIPNNVIICGGAPGTDRYARRCKAAGLPVHPARFPRDLAARVILECTDEGQTVYDPMGGSGTTAEVALDLRRTVITSEPMLSYVQGQMLRVDQLPGFQTHLPPHITMVR